MKLPEELETAFWKELQQYEEEKQMPYITSVERIGMKRGMEQGLQQGLQQGREEGIQQGMERGWERGLRFGIRGMLKVRFGTEGLALMKEIEQIEDVTLLEKIHEALEHVETLDEVRKVYVQENDDDAPAAEDDEARGEDAQDA
jgi:flagellar biosynthesis/type III secretory pathway protein FliH